MFVGIGVAGFLAVIWGILTYLAARLVKRAPSPEGDFRAAYRMNSLSLAVGILTGIAGIISVPLGLVESFSELDSRAPEERAQFLAGRIDEVMTSGGLIAVAGVFVSIGAITLWVLRRQNLNVMAQGPE